MLDALHNPDLAGLFLRVPVGIFFGIRGAQKVLDHQRRAGLVRTLADDHYPAVTFCSWWIPAWEFLAGTFLALGLFTPIAAAVLGLVCLMAILTDKLHEVKVKRHPATFCDWTCCVLFLSEVPMGLLMTIAILVGPGRYSLDAFFHL